MFSGLQDKLRVSMSKSEYVKRYNELVTDESWGPTGPQLDEICDLYPRGYQDLLQEMQYRLDARDTNWRRCYKTLLVIDHLARNLPIRYVSDLRAFLPTLRDIGDSFFHTDEKGTNLSVRERAKKVIQILTDESLLDEERKKAEHARRMCSGHGQGGSGRFDGLGSRKFHSDDRHSDDHHHHDHHVPRPGNDRFSGMGRDDVDRRRDHHDNGTSGTNYDPYVSKKSSAGGSGTTEPKAKEDRKARQEREDLEFARKLQAEENARGRGGGHTATNTMTRAQSNENADLALARRLQQEEDAGRGGSKNNAIHTAPVVVAQPAATPAPAPAQDDVFESMFGRPGPAGPSNSSTSAPPPPAPAPQPPKDAFGDFVEPTPSATSNKPPAPPKPAEDDFFSSRASAPTAPQPAPSAPAAAFDPFSDVPQTSQRQQPTDFFAGSPQRNTNNNGSSSGYQQQSSSEAPKSALDKHLDLFAGTASTQQPQSMGNQNQPKARAW